MIPTNRRHSYRFSGPYINSWRPLARSGLAGVRPALRLRAPCDRPGSGLRSCARAAPARTLLPDDLFAGLASRGLRRGVAQGPSRPSVVSSPFPAGTSSLLTEARPMVSVLAPACISASDSAWSTRTGRCARPILSVRRCMSLGVLRENPEATGGVS